MPGFPRLQLLTGVSLLSLAASASQGLAQVAQPGEQHGTVPLEEIVVTAYPSTKSRLDILQGTSVLAGEDLERALDATLGETLDGLPGLSQTAFGQGASRPVIRGLSGDRLRVLVNGLGTFDVSTTSPDHDVAVDVSTAESVEVVRGPATLIYGNNAVAGVVNVVDSRVPRALPETGGLDGFARTLFGTNADTFSFGGEVNAALGGGFMAHVDGSYLNTEDFEAPGFIRSEELRAAEPTPPGEEEPRGKAENSDQRAWGATGGLSYVGDWGFFGVSAGQWEKNYGIPAELEEEEGDAGPGEEEEEGGVRIDIEQTRLDVIGEIKSDLALLERMRFRFGYGDYEQVELEGGEIGTTFLNDAWEGRVDFVQSKIGGWSGSTGAQFRGRDFSAIGAEAFVPPNETFQWGLYTFQSYETGPWQFEAGLRLDRQDIEADMLSEEQFGPDFADGLDLGFTGISTSGSIAYQLPAGFVIGASGFRMERAPNAEELFSGGPHLATFTFEVGDPSLGEETVTGTELSFKKTEGRFTFALNGFFYSYDDFILERFTGEEEDGLRVAVFSAVDSRFYGFEAEAEYLAWQRGGEALLLDLVFDVVEAEEQNSGRSLPRIPPLSVQVGGEYQSALFDFRVASTFAREQEDLGAFELATDGYVDLTATLTIHPFEEHDVSLMIQGRNLIDDTIRHHTSFLKDLVPAPGRDFRLTLKAGF